MLLSGILAGSSAQEESQEFVGVSVSVCARVKKDQRGRAEHAAEDEPS